MRHNRKTVLVTTLLAGALVLTACGGRNTAHPAGGTDSTGTAGHTAAPAHIRLGVADGQRNASVRTAARVFVAGGTLTSVTLTDRHDGQRVRGTLSTDRRSWHPDKDLKADSAYRIDVQAASAHGASEASAAFTTLPDDQRLIGTYLPDGGTTVGVGMPVSFTFNKPVTDQRAVAEGIHVTSSSGQQVVGHWFGDRRIDFRPEHYWKAGSKVTVRIRLDGVQGAENAYGIQDKTVRFTVGRSQISTVDVATDTMRVVRDGHLVRTVPITSGAPGRTTYNGQMVISEKDLETEMDGASVGYAGEYDIPDVPHAMRLSTSGTFIHGNYWASDAVFGHSNVSHGCIGLNDVKGAGDPGQDGAWFYRNSMTGDVVVVKNSPDTTIAPDNGLNGWNMPWARWTAPAQ